LEKKVTSLKIAIAGSKDLVNGAKKVVDLRYKECRHHHNSHQEQNVKAERILGIVSQLQEVIGERWDKLHSFFLEKLEEEGPHGPHFPSPPPTNGQTSSKPYPVHISVHPSPVSSQTIAKPTAQQILYGQEHDHGK